MTDEELTDEELVKALRDTYDLVKMWPEKQPDGFTNLLVLRNLVPDTADRIEALTAERDDHWKSFVHWRKEADALTEQLEAARADAKEAEAYAEGLEKERDTAREYAGEVRKREMAAEDARVTATDKLAKAVEKLRDIAGDDFADVDGIRASCRATLAEIEGGKG
jgi:chromosome segregation ATPase